MRTACVHGAARPFDRVRDDVRRIAVRSQGRRDEPKRLSRLLRPHDGARVRVAVGAHHRLESQLAVAEVRAARISGVPRCARVRARESALTRLTRAHSGSSTQPPPQATTSGHERHDVLERGLRGA
jgi:hypothetical protein